VSTRASTERVSAGSSEGAGGSSTGGTSTTGAVTGAVGTRGAGSGVVAHALARTETESRAAWGRRCMPNANTVPVASLGTPIDGARAERKPEVVAGIESL
jgi:hypothetical protein